MNTGYITHDGSRTVALRTFYPRAALSPQRQTSPTRGKKGEEGGGAEKGKKEK